MSYTINEDGYTIKDVGLDPTKEEFSLTEIFFAMRTHFRKEDIESQFEGREEDLEQLSSRQREKLAKACADNFDEALGFNDSYWDCYWQTANYLIDDQLEKLSKPLEDPVSMKELRTLLERVSFAADIEEDENGRLYICLSDLQGAPMGDIEDVRFRTTGEVIDRMAAYWEDEFLSETASDEGAPFGDYREALAYALQNGDTETAKLIEIVSGESVEEMIEGAKVERVSVFYRDAVNIIHALYDCNRLSKLKNGDCVCFYNESEGFSAGWHAVSESEAAQELKDSLEGVTEAMNAIREEGGKPPAIEGFILHQKNGDYRIAEFSGETPLGEPQMWIYLGDGTSIEVTHEEDGLAPEEQYFSIRHHCSEKDFENDAYHKTCGVIAQEASNDVSFIGNALMALINASLEIRKGQYNGKKG